MRKKLQLPVKFYINEEGLEEFESMGIKTELEVHDGFINIFTDAITAWHEDSEGYTTLYFMGTDTPWRIYMSYLEFDELMREE